jgi:hypothetical protein
MYAAKDIRREIIGYKLADLRNDKRKGVRIFSITNV